MSAFEGRADFACQELSGPFLAINRYSTAIPTTWILASLVVTRPAEVVNYHVNLITCRLMSKPHRELNKGEDGTLQLAFNYYKNSIFEVVLVLASCTIMS